MEGLWKQSQRFLEVLQRIPKIGFFCMCICVCFSVLLFFLPVSDAKWKHSVCHFHWGALTQPLSMESTTEHFLDINMRPLHESAWFLLTGAIKISLLSFYLSLLLAKTAGRFIWEFFWHRSRERAQIWGLGTIHCLWDHGTEITQQLAASSKLFKGMIFSSR